MGAQSKPFLKLNEDLLFFVRATEVRLLNIVTSDADREVVLAQLAVMEGNAFNRSPFFLLDDAHDRSEEGWLARAERTRVLHELRREVMKDEPLPALPVLARAEGDARQTFARACQDLLRAYESVPAIEGVVIILAPSRMEGAEAFQEAVRALVEAPSLSKARWIVVDVDASTVPELVRDLGEERAMEATCVVDREAVREEQKRRIARAASAPADSPLEAQIGFAAPNVAPPPRVGKPSVMAMTPELGDALGPAAALAGPAGGEIRRAVYAAAHALQSGRGGEAVTHQRAAADRCFSLGFEREGTIMELVLAAYHLQLQQPERARDLYTRAATRAEPVDKRLAARGYLGLGATLALQKQAHESATAYARAGELAREADEQLLAVEAYRLAGQVALEGGSTKVAMSMWQRALGLAEGIAPEAVSSSSAAATARALAAACERNGLRDAAQSLLAQAERFEQGVADPGPSE